MKDFSRHQRLSLLIQRELTELIRRELDSPLFVWANLIHVEMRSDLKRAVVYVSHLNESDIEESVVQLNKAAGFLRGKLRVLKLKRIPELIFKEDHLLHQGEKMEALISQARDRDQLTDVAPATTES